MIDRHRLQWYSVLAIGVLFSIGGFAMAVSGDSRGWVVFFFFLFCAAMALHELWPRLIERHIPANPDTLLQNYPGPVTLRVPTFKLIFFVVSFIVFGGCLGWIAFYGDLGTFGNFFMWLGVAGAVVATPLYLVAIIRGSTLRLDAQGMQIVQGMKRSFHRWTDVGEFSVADAGVLSPARALIVVFDEAGTKDGKIAAFNRSLLGKGGGLPDTYGMDPWHLASLLNAWRTRSLANPQPQSQFSPAP
jgi:hypothetical protein